MLNFLRRQSQDIAIPELIWDYYRCKFFGNPTTHLFLFSNVYMIFCITSTPINKQFKTPFSPKWWDHAMQNFLLPMVNFFLFLRYITNIICTYQSIFFFCLCGMMLLTFKKVYITGGTLIYWYKTHHVHVITLHHWPTMVTGSITWNRLVHTRWW